MDTIWTAAYTGPKRDLLGFIRFGRSVNAENPVRGGSNAAFLRALVVEPGRCVHRTCRSTPNPFPRACTSNLSLQMGETPLHLAVVGGRESKVRALLANGALANAKDHVGTTPLHLAVRCDNAAAVAALLEYGARLDEGDEQGRTPLALALRNEASTAVRAVLTESQRKSLAGACRPRRYRSVAVPP
jgi:hypothetical protein